MKTLNITRLLLMAVSSLAVFSCGDMRDFSDTATVQPLSVKVLAVNASPEGEQIPLPDELLYRLIDDQQMITIRHTATGSEARITDIIPGVYTVKVSGVTEHDGKRYMFNGSIMDLPITKNDLSDISVKLTPSLSGEFIFKEIYFCGSLTLTGGNYPYDQFYEIYNNTDQVQYADGLCIACCYPTMASETKPVMIDRDGNDITDEWCYVPQIWMMPGDGDDYPIGPGESFVVAPNAWNHTQPEMNPNSIDLSGAEFEARTPPYYNTADDGPALNMLVQYGSNTGQYWFPPVYGPAMILFRPEGEIDPDFYARDKAWPTYGNYYMVDPQWVLDGVECVDNANKVNQKRIPSRVDAGATYVGELRIRKSVSRKVDDIVDGRYVFQDTNDSSDDFEIMDEPVIRRYGAGVPDWNTWLAR